MTEQTTTEMVERIEQLQEDRGGEEAHEIAELFIGLDAALTSGYPLPEQWPQAAELVELRTELAALRKALDDLRKALDNRRTVDGWVDTDPALRLAHVSCRMDSLVAIPVVALRYGIDEEGGGKYAVFESMVSHDEAYAAAAEWVRRQL